MKIFSLSNQVEKSASSCTNGKSIDCYAIKWKPSCFTKKLCDSTKSAANSTINLSKVISGSVGTWGIESQGSTVSVKLRDFWSAVEINLASINQPPWRKHHPQTSPNDDEIPCTIMNHCRCVLSRKRNLLECLHMLPFVLRTPSASFSHKFDSSRSGWGTRHCGTPSGIGVLHFPASD